MGAIMIQIEDKEKMSELCDKMMHYGGKLMQCIENMDEDMGERRGGMGYRDEYDPMYDDMSPRGNYSRYGGMGMRRGRDSMGRYARM